MPDDDRPDESLVPETESSPGSSPGSPDGSPFVGSSSYLSVSVTQERDTARPTIASRSGYVEPAPIIPTVASPETLELLDQASSIAGGHTDLSPRGGAPSAIELALRLDAALAAAGITAARAAPTAVRPSASNVWSARASAAEVSMRRPSFPLYDGPGDQAAALVSPKPVPVTALVASPAHGQVHVTGLARLFPANTVHAEDCGAVVDGNDCTLTATDHYHIRTVSVSFDSLMEPGSAGHDALRALLQKPTDKGVDAFQVAMRRLVQPHEAGETQASVPVKRTHATVVNGAAAIQQGDACQMNLTTNYVIEEVELPVCELFAFDRALVNSFLETVLEPAGGTSAAVFRREALRAAGCVDELALLDYSTELYGSAASVRGLFGITEVTGASAVMIGSANTLQTDALVKQGTFDLGKGASALDRIREEASQIRAAAGSLPASVLRLDLLDAIIEGLTLSRARAVAEPAAETLSPHTAVSHGLSAL